MMNHPDVRQALLQKGNIKALNDVLLISPRELARRCKISPSLAKEIVDTTYDAASRPLLSRLEEVKRDERFTTGDSTLDTALGGGIQTGTIYEVVGESAAGKTQLAMQLSISVQLPRSNGGLDGAACYLMTSATLPTQRILQMTSRNSAFSRLRACLDDIHTISTPTMPILINVLSQTLPAFIDERERADSKPIRLVILDALPELFHTSTKTTTISLVDRSKTLSEVSSLLHTIADKHFLAIVVINEVADAFYSNVDGRGAMIQGPRYSDQAQWFSGKSTLRGERSKQASLGLVWANQVNARILLTRTQRRRRLSGLKAERSKRTKATETEIVAGTVPDGYHMQGDQYALVRTLDVVFSSVCRRCTLEYIITDAWHNWACLGFVFEQRVSPHRTMLSLRLF